MRTENEILEELRQKIEALAFDRAPMTCRNHTTHRGTLIVTFVNGVWCHGGEFGVRPPFGEDLEALASMTFDQIKAYRGTIPGPVELVWRVEPMITTDENGKSLRVRLCFEPVLKKVNEDVYVTERSMSKVW